jgi:signal peptidase
MNDLHASFNGFGIKHLLKKKGWVDIPSNGNSMYPLIKEGNICRFISIKEKLVRGDIILYLSEEGHLVGHRYLHSYVENGALYHIFKGDTNFSPDPPVNENQLIGKLAWIKKKHLCFQAKGLLANWWGAVVLTLPVLPRFCKRFRYSNSKVGSRNKRRHHA